MPSFICCTALFQRRPGLEALLIIMALVVTACAGLPDTPSGTLSLPSTSAATLPGDAGLHWQECELESDVEAWKQAETCLGHPLPEKSAAEKAWAAQGPAGGRALRIGQHLYSTHAVEIPHMPWSIYTLSRDGWPITAFAGQQTGHDPDIALLNLGNRAAWEFADDGQATISYDGRRIGPQFDRIIAAYCCETVLYCVRAGDGRYAFWASRDGRRYVVEVSAE